MCDVCKSENLDPHFINGKKYKLYLRYICYAFKGKIIPLKLCFLHDIDLYVYGEEKFIRSYPKLNKEILNSLSSYKQKRSEFGAEDSLSFGGML